MTRTQHTHPASRSNLPFHFLLQLCCPDTPSYHNLASLLRLPSLVASFPPHYCVTSSVSLLQSRPRLQPLVPGRLLTEYSNVQRVPMTPTRLCPAKTQWGVTVCFEVYMSSPGCGSVAAASCGAWTQATRGDLACATGLNQTKPADQARPGPEPDNNKNNKFGCSRSPPDVHSSCMVSKPGNPCSSCRRRRRSICWRSAPATAE